MVCYKEKWKIMHGLIRFMEILKQQMEEMLNVEDNILRKIESINNNTSHIPPTQ